MNATSVAVLLLHLQWQDVTIVADDEGMEIFLCSLFFYLFAGVIGNFHASRTGGRGRDYFEPRICCYHGF